MDPVLDETSLVPCLEFGPAARIDNLSNVLKALDSIGIPRALRTVSDAADRDISMGQGLRFWCFDHNSNRDAGRFIASRLSRQPFIDGPDGLMAQAEGQRALETLFNGELVYGLGLGALEGRLVASLSSGVVPYGRKVDVQVVDASTDPIAVSNVTVSTYAHRNAVTDNNLILQDIVDEGLLNGQVLLESIAEVFPHLLLGPKARESFSALSGSEPVFQQLIRHLRALNSAAEVWVEGSIYLPLGVTFSPESGQTLSHGRYGPARDFPTPEGFVAERWSFHTKLTGGSGARMYFRAVRSEGSKTVLIGYFGPHLPCVRYPT